MLFSNAIQTLSQMAIQEAGVDIPQSAEQTLLEDLDEQLRNMPCLTEEECRFRPEAVVVKASNRLGRYLIEMEDLSRYMITNQITSVQEAIGNILEVNDLQGQFYNVGIVVDESSIREEMEELGYAVSGAMKTPPKGLGLAMIGKQEDFSKIRRIANSKQLMDVLTGRYGLPLIKKNYQQVGFLESKDEKDPTEEDVQIKKGKDDQIIHEEDPKGKEKGKKDKDKDSECPTEGDIPEETKDDKKKSSKSSKKDEDDGSDNEAERTEQPGDEDPMQESAFFGQMSAHDLQLQRIRDIAAGKMDAELW